jgi:hypothetical protein
LKNVYFEMATNAPKAWYINNINIK